MKHDNRERERERESRGITPRITTKSATDLTHRCFLYVKLPL